MNDWRGKYLQIEPLVDERKSLLDKIGKQEAKICKLNRVLFLKKDSNKKLKEYSSKIDRKRSKSIN